MKDRGFATPDKDEAAAAEARKKKAELDAEIETVKKEYAEKIKKKAEKKKVDPSEVIVRTFGQALRLINEQKVNHFDVPRMHLSRQ